MTDDASVVEAGETLEQYGDRIAAKVRCAMMDRLDDDVIGCLGQSHIVFGKACAMEAVTTAMTEMQAGIDQAKALREKDGWRLVPVEPTEAMCEAAERLDSGDQELWLRDDCYARIYAAMLSAAPVVGEG